jgi:hypothetical protein
MLSGCSRDQPTVPPTLFARLLMAIDDDEQQGQKVVVYKTETVIGPNGRITSRRDTLTTWTNHRVISMHDLAVAVALGAFGLGLRSRRFAPRRRPATIPSQLR